MADLKRDKKYVKNYKSHPKKLLIDHILGVEKRALQAHFSYLVSYASKFHDLGKLNENFAIKLKGEKTDKYSNHSYLSFLIAHTFYEICKKKNKILFSEKDLYLILACVIKHHGSLINLYELVNKEESQRLTDFLCTKPYIPAYILLELIRLDKVEPFEIISPINPINNKPVMGSILSKTNLDKNMPKDEKLVFFLDIRLCFSALIYGDKGDAGNQNLNESRKIFKKFIESYSFKINNYTKSFKQISELDVTRTLIRNSVVDKFEQRLSNTDEHCFSLTCPTGSGKTAILLTLAKSIISKKKNIERVIYSIPFLTITEQVFEIIEKIFDNDFDSIKRIDSKAIPTEDFDFDNEQERSRLDMIVKKLKKFVGIKDLNEQQIERLLQQNYLESSFEFPLIVTTFVQFFQSFTTSSNKGLMRFAHLKNSIFLVDELQALPPSLYTFFVALIDEFCRKNNSYAIFSTATMPFLQIPKIDIDSQSFFKNYKTPTELSDLGFFNHDVFNRYIIKVLEKQFFTNTICEEIIKNKTSTLVVVNTIKDSEDIFKILRLSASNVFLINSNFHAYDRRKILKEVNELIRNKEQVFLVSTQLIEAGVDISFDVLYRDIAPLPHIIQAAGRCNRGNTIKKGVVYLFRLYKETEKKIQLRAKTIYRGKYEGCFLNKTIEVFFGSKTEFEEKELLTLQQSFFEYISDNFLLGQWINEKDEEVNFIEQISNYKYGDIGRFTVIPRENRKGEIQVQFYVPENNKDSNYEVLYKLIVEQYMLDETPEKTGEDKLRNILALKSKTNQHLRKMMDRVVQTSVSDNPILYANNDYASPVCNMYELKPEFYDSIFGLNV